PAGRCPTSAEEPYATVACACLARVGGAHRFGLSHRGPWGLAPAQAVRRVSLEAAAVTRQLSVLVEVGESAREDVGLIRLPPPLDLRPIRGVAVDARGAP